MKSEDICSVGSKGETNEQLVNAEPEIPRREPRKACITQIQEIQVTLADINGVHPAITVLEKELFLPPLGFSLGLSLKSEQKMEIVQSALRAMPARLTKSHGKYRCIGNVRLYRLAVSCLAPSEEISALVTTSRDKRDVIQPNYLAEIYCYPLYSRSGWTMCDASTRSGRTTRTINFSRACCPCAQKQRSLTHFALVRPVSQKIMKHQSPIKSEAHQVLRAKSAQAGIAEQDLRDLLWLINADDTLTCFVAICENLLDICRLMDENFASYCAEHQITAKQWTNIANWVIADAEDLAAAIGEQFNQRPEKREEEQSLDGGSKPSLINPLVGHCATRNSLYTVLLNSLASEDVAERERYLLMVGQLLVAHAHVCRKHIPRQKYENHAGSREITGYPNTPYTAAFAIRVFSGEEDFSFCPRWLNPKQSPQEFALAANQYVADQDALSKHLAGYCRFIARAHGFLGWSNRSGGGGRRGHRGGGRWIPGYVRLGPDCEVVPTEVGDSEDPNADWGRQVVVQEVLEDGAPITKTRARQLLVDDIYPFDLAGEDELCLTEYPCNETTRELPD